MASSIDIRELPKPPSDKKGWPWTVSDQENQYKDSLKSSNSSLPRFSVVTPSFNQGQYLEETIRSVLLQDYPNLEYIIIDGGSEDNSIEIIKKYEKFLKYWVSEKDRGQSHAINKGFSHSTGELMGWINSDDTLKPGALRIVSELIGNMKEPAWVVGVCELTDSNGSFLDYRKPNQISYKSILNWLDNWFAQEATFWNRSIWNIVGELDESLFYCLDVDLWMRMIAVAKPKTTSAILATYRYHKDAKCIKSQQDVKSEMILLLKRNLKDYLQESIKNYALDVNQVMLFVSAIQRIQDLQIAELVNELAAVKGSFFWKLRKQLSRYKDALSSLLLRN